MEKRRLDAVEQVVLIPSIPPPSVVGILTSLNKEKGRLYKAVLEKLKGTRTGHLSSNSYVSSPKQVPASLTPSRVQTLEITASKARVQPQGGATFNTKQSVESSTRHCSSSRPPPQTSLLTGTDVVQSMPSELVQPEKKRKLTAAANQQQTRIKITSSGKVKYTLPEIHRSHDMFPHLTLPPISEEPLVCCPSTEQDVPTSGDSGNVAMDTTQPTRSSSSDSPVLKNVLHFSRPALENLEKKLQQAEEVAISLLYSDGTSLLRKESSQQQHCSDVECEGVCLALACGGGDGECKKLEFYLLPMDANQPAINQWTRSQLEGILSSEKTQTLCYSSQDLMTTVIEHYNLGAKSYITWRVFDPLIAAWLLDSENPPTSFARLLSKYRVKNISTTGSSARDHICRDLMQLGPVALVLYQEMQKHGLWQLFSCVETPVIPLVAGMEASGIAVDIGVLKMYNQIITKRMNEVEKEAHSVAGHTFLLTSAQQLRKVMYDELHLDLKCTKPLMRTAVQRHKSTSELVLNQLKDFHSLPSLILEYRQLLKLKSTYIDGVVPFVVDGALKPNWIHPGTSTGRLVSASPNIQSFPKQEISVSDPGAPSKDIPCNSKTVTVDIRQAVSSRPGFTFIAADFKSIELRLLAHLSQDVNLLRVINSPESTDIFTHLTSEWLGKTDSEVSSLERERTKRVVYGIVYGVGKDRLAEMLNTTSQLAKELMDGFLSKFNGVQTFIHKTIEFCHKHGYVSSMLGRKRFLPSVHSHNHADRTHSERQAVNFIVQGSAADLCKCSMVEVMELLSNESPRARLVLQIHDELVYEVPCDHIGDLTNKIRSTLESCSLFQSLSGSLKVGIEVRIKDGQTWRAFS